MKKSMTILLVAAVILIAGTAQAQWEINESLSSTNTTYTWTSPKDATLVRIVIDPAYTDAVTVVGHHIMAAGAVTNNAIVTNTITDTSIVSSELNYHLSNGDQLYFTISVVGSTKTTRYVLMLKDKQL